jgi:hypothetical protein
MGGAAGGEEAVIQAGPAQDQADHSGRKYFLTFAPARQKSLTGLAAHDGHEGNLRRRPWLRGW